MTSFTLAARRASTPPGPFPVGNARRRPMKVHWSVQSAARDAMLQRANAARRALRQPRKLGCEEDPELFYDDDTAAQREAQRICWDCPVRRRCLEVALVAESTSGSSNGTYSNGTVGGVTAAARERLVRARRRGQPVKRRGTDASRGVGTRVSGRAAGPV